VNKKFPTWKTIDLGRCSSVQGYCEAFKQGYHCSVGGYRAPKIIMASDIVISQNCTRIELVNVSNVDLGLKKATRSGVYKRAKMFGLDLCPNEVGFVLRMEYREQPDGEELLIAMKPIKLDGDADIFTLTNHRPPEWDHNVYLLDVVSAHAGLVHEADTRWVFMRHK